MVALVTGAAGFIGYHVARRLADRGEQVIGVDNLNHYYDTELKRRRLAQLAGFKSFTFRSVDLHERDALANALKGETFRRIIHLAAQANVRYSLENPQAYIDANVTGHLNILEYCRYSGRPENVVYASSSSVYGRENDPPFGESAVTDKPASLYGVTKKTQEMMSAAYAGLFGIPQIGLRFFSVYGPWGRPDMAYWIFTEAMLKDAPIRVFNHGNMSRDFTYIDDVVTGVLAVADSPPTGATPHRIYNIGNSSPVGLLEMIATLEQILGRKARLDLLPAQPGDVPVTYADTSAMREDFGFQPTTPLAEGLKRFVDWFRRYHRLT
jgi:UDP-glucuronate 4-epimerase